MIQNSFSLPSVLHVPSGPSVFSIISQIVYLAWCHLKCLRTHMRPVLPLDRDMQIRYQSQILANEVQIWQSWRQPNLF